MAAVSWRGQRSRAAAAIGWGALALAVIAGAYGRLAHLDALGLWMDEGWTLFFARYADFADLLQENHPPLYYLALKLPLALFDGDVALRATGAIASAGSVWVTWRLARAMGGSVVAACLAAAAVAVASADIAAARQLRMYPWMVLLFALALAAVWRWRASGRDRDLWWVLPPAAALCYLHGIGVFYAGAACLFALLLAPDWKQRWRVVLLGVATLVLLAPWTIASTLQRVGLMDGQAGLIWRQHASVGAMLSAPLRLFVDSSPLGAAWPAGGSACGVASWPALCELLGLGTWRLKGYLPLGMFVLALLALVAAGVVQRLLARGSGADAGDERTQRGLLGLLPALLVCAAMPYLLLVAVELKLAPWFDVRYLVPLTVPLALVFGLWAGGSERALQHGGAAAHASPRAAAVLVLAVVALSALAYPQMGTWQQIREAVDALAARQQDGELVYVNGEGQGSGLLVSRYLERAGKKPPLLELRNYVYDNYRSECPPQPGNCLDRLEPAAGAPKRAWMIRMPNRLDEPARWKHGAALQAWIAQHYTEIGVTQFDGVAVIEMQRR